MPSIARIGTVPLLLAILAGCYEGTSGDAPPGPTDPTPSAPSEVSAVIYGNFISTPAIFPASIAFDVRAVDCVQRIGDVTAINRFPGKRKLTYKYLIKAKQAPFQACVRVTATYTKGPDEGFLVAEAVRHVMFTPQTGGVAPVGVQADIPLP